MPQHLVLVLGLGALHVLSADSLDGKSNRYCLYRWPRHNVSRRLEPSRLVGTLPFTQYCGPNPESDFTYDLSIDRRAASGPLDRCCLEHDYCLAEHGACVEHYTSRSQLGSVRERET